MTNVRSEDRRQARVMVLSKPEGKDTELVVSRKHGIESRQIAECLFDDARLSIDKYPMNQWRIVSKLFCATCRKQESNRVFTLGLFVQIGDDQAKIVDAVRGGLGSRSRIERGKV